MKKPQDTPSRHADKFIVRFPDGMRDRIAAAAEKSGRSMNAEIVQRLEWALTFPGEPTPRAKTPQPVGGDLTWYITSEIRQLAEQQGVPFDEMLAKIFVAGLHPEAPQVLYLAVLPGATKDDMKDALIASEAAARPDAALITEMIQRAPWAPAWVKERLEAQGHAVPSSHAEDDPSATRTIAIEMRSPASPPRNPTPTKPRVRRPAKKPSDS